MRENIFATLPTAEAATKAVGALLDHGVQSTDISILMKSVPAIEGESHELREHAESGISVTTAGDAGSGAVSGAGIGLGLGTLAAIASVTLPGVGIILGGGALVAALAGMVGATAAGAIAGGVTGFLKDQGVEPVQIEVFSSTLESGGALIGVSYPSGGADLYEIQSVLEKYGGIIHPMPSVYAVPREPGPVTVL